MAGRFVCALVAAVALFAAPSARAATLTFSGGVLTYTAAPGEQNNVSFDESNPGTRLVQVHKRGLDDDAIAGSGCLELTPGTDFACPGVTKVVADAGDQDDTLDATRLADIPATLIGGAGDDTFVVKAVK